MISDPLFAELIARLGYDVRMNWSARIQSHPQFGQAVRFATGRPPWVLKATGFVAVLVFAIPLIALTLLMIAAVFLTGVAWVVFSFIARVIDALSGYGKVQSPTQTPPADDGRENVRIINRS
jgi:hypothetical protein